MPRPQNRRTDPAQQPPLEPEKHLSNQIIQVTATTLDYNTFYEAEQVRKAVGMSQRAFVRFCILQTILLYKNKDLRFALSKDTIEKTFREEGTEMFDQLQRRLLQKNIPFDLV